MAAKRAVRAHTPTPRSTPHPPAPAPLRRSLGHRAGESGACRCHANAWPAGAAGAGAARGWPTRAQVSAGRRPPAPRAARRGRLRCGACRRGAANRAPLVTVRARRQGGRGEGATAGFREGGHARPRARPRPPPPPPSPPPPRTWPMLGPAPAAGPHNARLWATVHYRRGTAFRNPGPRAPRRRRRHAPPPPRPPQRVRRAPAAAPARGPRGSAARARRGGPGSARAHAAAAHGAAIRAPTLAHPHARCSGGSGGSGGAAAAPRRRCSSAAAAHCQCRSPLRPMAVAAAPLTPPPWRHLHARCSAASAAAVARRRRGGAAARRQRRWRRDGGMAGIGSTAATGSFRRGGCAASGVVVRCQRRGRALPAAWSSAPWRRPRRVGQSYNFTFPKSLRARS